MVAAGRRDSAPTRRQLRHMTIIGNYSAKITPSYFSQIRRASSRKISFFFAAAFRLRRFRHAPSSFLADMSYDWDNR